MDVPNILHMGDRSANDTSAKSSGYTKSNDAAASFNNQQEQEPPSESQRTALSETITTFADGKSVIHVPALTAGPVLPIRPKKAEHPHAGATFENGRIGMVVNPTPVRLSSYNKNQHKCHPRSSPPSNTIGDDAKKIVEKVHDGIVASQRSLVELQSKGGQSSSSSPRILCMVYTYDDNGGPHSQNLQAIADTWGKRCDGFLAASNVTDHSVGAINLLHLGPEEYTNMWQKVRSMWSYAYDHYLEQYDYFHICGDDVFLVVDNVRAYLQSNQVKQLLDGHLDIFSKGVPVAEATAQTRPRPLLLGMPLMNGIHKYAVGGPGYTLNRAAVKRLVEEGLPHSMTDTQDLREDVFVGGMLHTMGVLASDTRDDHNSWRYVESAAFHASNPNDVQGFWEPRIMKRQYPQLTYPESGMDFVSSETVSFHLKRSVPEGTSVADLMHQYDSILYSEDEMCRISHSFVDHNMKDLTFALDSQDRIDPSAFAVE